MKVCRNRIFISNLPETATEEAIRNAFSEYGKVVSVEIKKRKELGTKNSSLFFAYINMDIDHKTLQQCFKDFSTEKWLGQYVFLQLARESFLDRLKREREANPLTEPSESVPQVINNGKHNFVPKFMEVGGENVKKKLNSFSELKPTVQDEPPIAIIKNDQQVIESEKMKIEEEESNIVIKNNRGQTYNSGLKIASVGKEPIIQINKTKNKVEVNNSKANIKRLQSLKNLKKDYQNQKSLVQAALSKIDIKPKNKIIFDDIEEPNSQQQYSSKDTKKVLFENEESDEDFEGNFEVKEQFQGAEGQKLLALQSKYKNDKRFTLDSRFLENDNGNLMNNSHSLPEDDDITLEEEKKREYAILNKILGKGITNLDKKPESQKKVMLRFDPSQAEHSKFEVKKVVLKEQKKRKRDDNMNEKKQEEKEIPEVSKEIFYKVTDDLKDSLQEKKEFSLLSLFGKSSEQVADDEEEPLKTVPKNNLVNEKNPFRYDSSDDDNETEEILKPENVETSEEQDLQPQSEIKQRNFWVESFFFKPDDYRLQEGFDFIEKIKSEDRLEFTKLRRELKEVVKAKVRNNQRKNKPFKKKLGGNKRKKMLRMKKAMKR